MSKLCHQCNLVKDESDFNINKMSRDGLRSECRACSKKYTKRYAKKRRRNPELQWEYDLWCKFRLTVKDYYQKLAEQNGVCAICHRLDSANRRLAVDHNHATGQIRSLLCFTCNARVVGHFENNPGLLQSTVNYFERWQIK